MKILIFIGLLVVECYCFNLTKHFLQLDDNIISILQHPMHGKDEFLLKDFIQFAGVNYHLKEIIIKNETDLITPAIKTLFDFTPKCIECIMEDEYKCFAEGNQQKFKWTWKDFMYFDSFAKDAAKLWHETAYLLDSINYSIGKIPVDFDATAIEPVKYNKSVPLEDRICWESNY